MKLTIRKTLLISLGLLGVLGLAGLAVSFFEVNRTISIGGQFQYRTVTPVVASESGFVDKILAQTDAPMSAGTPIMILVNDDLNAEIEDLLNQISILEIDIAGIDDQQKLEALTAQEQLATLHERLANARDTETLREESYQLNKGLYETGRVSKTSIDELELQSRAASIERGAIESAIKTAQLAVRVSEASYERQTQLKMLSLTALQDRLRFLEEKQRRLTIVAPDSGVLFAEDIDQKLNSYIAKGTKIGDIVSFDDINFLGLANGTDIIRIQEGQKAYFDVDVFRRKVFVQGTVSHVGYETQAGPSGQALFPVEIHVDNKAFLNRGNELYIQAGVPGAAVIVVEEDLSLIALVWEKILDFVDFEVYIR